MSTYTQPPPASDGESTFGQSWLAVDRQRRERELLCGQVRDSQPAGRFCRLFPRWPKTLEHLSWRGLNRLAHGESLNPNDADVWVDGRAHAQAVLRATASRRWTPAG